MNPANDLLVRVTPEELAALLREKRPGRPRDTAPKAVTGFSLPLESRLWYVAEFIHQARLAKRAGKPDLEQSWRERGQDIAAEVASIYVHAPPDEKGKEVAPELLRQVADALDGKHLKIVTTAREDARQAVLHWVHEYCRENDKLPTQKALGEFAKSSGVKLRKADISETFNTVQMKFPSLRQK